MIITCDAINLVRHVFGTSLGRIMSLEIENAAIFATWPGSTQGWRGRRGEGFWTISTRSSDGKTPKQSGVEAPSAKIPPMFEDFAGGWLPEWHHPPLNPGLPETKSDEAARRAQLCKLDQSGTLDQGPPISEWSAIGLASGSAYQTKRLLTIRVKLGGTLFTSTAQ